MGCPLWNAYQSADAARAEIIGMVLEDEEGFDAEHAAAALEHLVDLAINETDVRAHRAMTCDCGGHLVRSDIEA